MTRTKRKKIPLYKYSVGTLDHVRLIGSKNGKDLIIAEMQKRKPSYLVKKTIGLERNPDKVLIYPKTKSKHWMLQIFYYKNNPELLHFAQSGSLISIPLDILKEVLDAIQSYINSA